jgi:hypothetical protein
MEVNLENGPVHSLLAGGGLAGFKSMLVVTRECSELAVQHTPRYMSKTKSLTRTISRSSGVASGWKKQW